MSHPEAQQLAAYFDGELEAAAARDIQQHLLACDRCRAQLQQLAELRSAMRKRMTHHTAPLELRAQLARVLDRETQSVQPQQRARRPFWWGVVTGGLSTAAAAALALIVWLQPLRPSLVDELVAAHLHSTRSQQLIAVASTDRHTVKPWFASHADVSPVVADFAAQGYRLIGGRADDVNSQRAAVIVYEHGAHIISVYSWVAQPHEPPQNTTRRGYHLAFWRAADLEYCAVSDAGWDELRALQILMQELSVHDARE